MQCLSRQPAAPLAALVESIWYFEGEAFGHAAERVLPTARMQLVVNLAVDRLRWADRDGSEHTLGGAVVSGAYESAFSIQTADQRCVTGVCFRPGGAAAFLGPVVLDVSNTHVELAEIPGLADAREQLGEAAELGPAAVLDAWERCLLAQLRPDARTQMGVLSATAGLLDQGLTVQAVADAMSMSARKLRHDFKASVGLAPKAFARVRRLQRALRLIVGQPQSDSAAMSWADVAASAGYFDQAHMVHDFRRLTGATPTAYHPRSTRDHNHAIAR